MTLKRHPLLHCSCGKRGALKRREEPPLDPPLRVLQPSNNKWIIFWDTSLQHTWMMSLCTVTAHSWEEHWLRSRFSEARRGSPQSQGMEVPDMHSYLCILGTCCGQRQDGIRVCANFSGPLRTKKSVRAFNYRCFIPNFADIAVLLSDLIKASLLNKVT